MKYGLYVIDDKFCKDRKEILIFLPNYIQHGCLCVHKYYKLACHVPKYKRFKFADLSEETHNFMKLNAKLISQEPKVIKIFKDPIFDRRFFWILEERINLVPSSDICKIAKTWWRLAHKQPYTRNGIVNNDQLADFVCKTRQKNVELGGE